MREEEIGPARQQRRRAASAVPECVVRATDQMPRVEVCNQNLIDKVIGGHAAESGVEGELVDDGDPVFGQESRAGCREGKVEWGIVRAKQLARMRLERQDCQRKIRPGGMSGRYQMPMATMHTVEIAQCNAGAARFGWHCTPICK